jgi:hypothetical protein
VTVEHAQRIASLQAQDAREVLGLIARQRNKVSGAMRIRCVEACVHAAIIRPCS